MSRRIVSNLQILRAESLHPVFAPALVAADWLGRLQSNRAVNPWPKTRLCGRAGQSTNGDAGMTKTSTALRRAGGLFALSSEIAGNFDYEASDACGGHPDDGRRDRALGDWTLSGAEFENCSASLTFTGIRPSLSASFPRLPRPSPRPMKRGNLLRFPRSRPHLFLPHDPRKPSQS